MLSLQSSPGVLDIRGTRPGHKRSSCVDLSSRPKSPRWWLDGHSDGMMSALTGLGHPIRAIECGQNLPYVNTLLSEMFRA
jgi:hypothetical protein